MSESIDANAPVAKQPRMENTLTTESSKASYYKKMKMLHLYAASYPQDTGFKNLKCIKWCQELPLGTDDHPDYADECDSNIEDTMNTHDESVSDDWSDGNDGGHEADDDNTDICNIDGSDDESTSNDEPPTTFSMSDNMKFLELLTMKPNTTVQQVIPAVLALSIRYRLTYEATEGLFKLLNAITIGNKLPNRIEGVWKLLSRTDESTIIRHVYCRNCRGYLGQESPNVQYSCEECGPEGSLSYFIQVSLLSQLREFLAIPGIAETLEYRYNRTKKDPDGIEDVYDGKEYKKKSQPGEILHCRNNYSFTINTDGCSLAESSNASAWPILLQINELPPHARKRHLFLAGVWVDNEHPLLNVLLLPTVKELRELYKDGINWTPHGTDKVITSRFVTLICSVDSVARAALLAMTQYNGHWGCTYCYKRGTQNGARRTYNAGDPAPYRSDYRIRQHMTKASKEHRRIFGVAGSSVMKLLPMFNIALGTVVESMHCLFLGVAKQHTLLLLFGKSTDEWYCGSPPQLTTINSRLKDIRPPNRISRTPRPVQTMKQWKASEWRNWLLYYSLPCLEGIVSQSHLNLLALLSRASYNLDKHSISIEELEEAQILLEKYVIDFQESFSEVNMSYNVHLLTHLTRTVENWGPLWAHCAFPFESWNKKITDSVTSANSRPLQIAVRFAMRKFIENLIYDPAIPLATRQLVHSILCSGKKGQSRPIEALEVKSDFHASGKAYNGKECPAQSRALRKAGFDPKQLSLYDRAIIKGVDYRCRGGNENTRFCNKFIYCKTFKFGEILKIACFHHDGREISGLFINRLSDAGNAFHARHIMNVVPTDDIEFITSDDVEGPVITISTLYGCRAIRLANVWEAD